MGRAFKVYLEKKGALGGYRFESCRWHKVVFIFRICFNNNSVILSNKTKR